MGGAARVLPRCLPILGRSATAAGGPARHEERELTEPVLLCDERGRLSPDAVGWSRVPLVTANLRGRWPRKKRWNFWNWICGEFVLSVTVADIDYASFCSVAFTDFETGQSVEATDLRRSGFVELPDRVERSLRWRSPRIEYALRDEGGDIEVSLAGGQPQKADVRAEFQIRRPVDHESLNVVVPWTPRHFQLNSKHNTLRCEGHVTVAGRRYEMRPESCHAVQDWGRGIWPYRSCWNWAVCTGEQAGELIGVNLGDRWTTGTGSTENGICYEGRLTKIMEDVDWQYDPSDPRKPWRICSTFSDAIDLTLTPGVVHERRLSLGLLRTRGFCAFGRWSGVVRCGGREIEIRDLVGWAEEFDHRW